MNNPTKPDAIAAELFMSPVERAQHDGSCKTMSYGTRIGRCYALCQNQADDLRAAKDLLGKIEKTIGVKPREARRLLF